MPPKKRAKSAAPAAAPAMPAAMAQALLAAAAAGAPSAAEQPAGRTYARRRVGRGAASAGPSSAPAAAPAAAPTAAPNAAAPTAAAPAAAPTAAPNAAAPTAAAPAAAPTAAGPDNESDGENSDFEIAEEHDDGDEAAETTDGASAWKPEDDFQFSQRVKSLGDEREFDPKLNLDGYASKGIFEYAKHFLPMHFLTQLANKMEANGQAKRAAGQSEYNHWTVTVDDVLQWIGVWMYILAFPQHGGRDSFFRPPEGGFGPTHDLKKWLKIGKPDAERGIAWFQQMHACFELPTYNRANDPFNKTRKFWDSLREAFKSAVTCSWIMCLDESMIKWLGRGMPGFMHVPRKPTPMGLELHTLCCGVCGILLWFEVYEGKAAMAEKLFCDTQKTKLGSSGPWKTVALTLRMVQPWIATGRVLIADSWFGSVPCILALFSVGLFAVMMVKTAHKDYPKQQLLDSLGYDKKTKLCPKERRGEHHGFSRDYTVGSKSCTVLAAGHNSKKPVLLIATASSLTAAEKYKKTWTKLNAAGEMVKTTLEVATTAVHALYHKFFHLVDVHNHLRQGLVAMADVWPTKDWSERHFAEGLGFWEVNVFKALAYFHPDHAGLKHPRFRVLLAHAMLTLGKVPFGEEEADTEEGPPDHACCMLARFARYHNEKHQCGYCKRTSYW